MKLFGRYLCFKLVRTMVHSIYYGASKVYIMITDTGAIYHGATLHTSDSECCCYTTSQDSSSGQIQFVLKDDCAVPQLDGLQAERVFATKLQRSSGASKARDGDGNAGAVALPASPQESM